MECPELESCKAILEKQKKDADDSGAAVGAYWSDELEWGEIGGIGI